MSGSILKGQALQKRIAEGKPVFAYIGDGRGTSFCGWFKVEHFVPTSFVTPSGECVYAAAGEYVTGRFVGQTAFSLVPCFYTKPVKTPMVYAIKGGHYVRTKKS